MSTRAALVYSFLDRYSGLFIHTASSIVLARLLTPAEIGVYSVTMVALGFLATFRDLGASQFLVREPDLTSQKIRAAWAVQLGLALAFSALIAGIGIPAADFYREPRMAGIMYVVALNFAITPFLAMPIAWLTRQMRFGAIASTRFAGAVAHASVAIGLALADLGPISLAFANLASTAVGILVVALVGNVKFPKMPTLVGVRRVLSFGGQLTIVSLLDTMARGAPELFLGKLQGMADAGLFSRGQGLVAMFERLVMEAVNPVAMSLFAKQTRDGENVAGSFLHAAALVTVLAWSFFASVGVLAYPAVHVLYGDQWDNAVDSTRWLAAAMALGIPGSICIVPLIAGGHVTRVLTAAALWAGVEIAAAGIGAVFGLLQLTQLLLPAAAISTTIWLTLAQRQFGFAWMQLARVFAGSAMVAAATTATPLVVSLVLGWRSPEIWTTLVICLPGALFGFVASAYLTRHLIWSEIVRLVPVRLR